MVDIPTLERAFRWLGITGQAAGILMVAFGVLVIVFPALTDVLLGAFFVLAGLLQLGGNAWVARFAKLVRD